MRAHLNDGKLCALRRLDHVQVAIRIARVKRLDRCGYQKIALSRVANALSACGVAGAVNLMHGMRHVIAETGLLQDVGRVRLGEERVGNAQCSEREAKQKGQLHRFSQNLRWMGHETATIDAP